jgi:hypothetical protein
MRVDWQRESGKSTKTVDLRFKLSILGGPMPRQRSDNLQSLVDDFVQQIVATVETAAARRVQAAVESVIGGALRRAPGRPAQNGLSPGKTRKARRKPPRQYYPYPQCKNPAAPIFGMVCSKHKDVPKSEIKKYREQRRKDKLKARQ